MGHVIAEIIEFLLQSLFDEVFGVMWKSKPLGRLGCFLMLAAFAA
jgi:hypothetical protein